MATKEKAMPKTEYTIEPGKQELTSTVVLDAPLTFRLAVVLGQAGLLALCTRCQGVVELPISCTQSFAGHLLSISTE